MDSSGHIYDLEPDGRLTNKSPEPVPAPMRGVLVMKALEAYPGPPKWWPELAPLTEEERRFVFARLAGRASAPTLEEEAGR
jgi:hypothetical protein